MNKKEFDGWSRTIAAMVAAGAALMVYRYLLEEIELSKDPEWVISTKIRKEWREDQL